MSRWFCSSIVSIQTDDNALGTEPNLSVTKRRDVHFHKMTEDIYRPQTKLPKGNVFTSVCQEFCPLGVYLNMHWCRHPPGQTPPPPRRLLQRTVRILLECILVLPNFLHFTFRNLFKCFYEPDYLIKQLMCILFTIWL